jgi:hypothetical protein
MNYFVTGATGFIGGRVARQLVEAGHHVIALVRNKSKAVELRALGIELYQGDITDKESMRQPMSRAEGVFHAAAWYMIGARDSHLAESVNVGTQNVLRVMKGLKSQRSLYKHLGCILGYKWGPLMKPTGTKAHGSASMTEPSGTIKSSSSYRLGLPLIIVRRVSFTGIGPSIMGYFQEISAKKIASHPETNCILLGACHDAAGGTS